MTNFPLWLLGTAISGLCTASSHQMQPIDDIRQTAKEYVQQQPQIQRLAAATVIPGRLDPRLKLERCDQPLVAFLPAGGKLVGKSTVGVRCTGTSPWTLYVPVTITAYVEVATANHALSRGAIMTDDDFSLVQQPLAQLPAGYLQDPESVAGMELKRTVSAGKTLTRNMLKSPRLIKRGQHVTLIAQSRHFAVQMNGKALSDGAKGDRIQVRNLSSKKVVEGTVNAQGAVIVD